MLEDADFNTACLIGIGPLMHAGQGCAAPTRLLLPRSRYDEGVAILKGIYENIAAGDPQDPGTLCGPVISGKQQERILGYIQKGVDEGATMLVGSTEAPKEFDKGFWVSPTLFTDVDNSMTIAQEEIFGPVLVVIPYEDEEDAIRIANDSVYGLAGNVMSSSLDRSLAVARRLRAGFIGLNGTAGYGADVPFGGYKDSGVGRQNGIAGFDQYTEVKSVAYPADEGVGHGAAFRRPRGLRVVRRRRIRRRTRPVHRAGAAAPRGTGAAARHVGALPHEESLARCSSCTGTRTSSRCCATTRRSRRPVVIAAFGPVLGEGVMLGMDEPVHGRLRSLVPKAFTQKSLARWEDELVGRVGNEPDRQVRRKRQGRSGEGFHVRLSEPDHRGAARPARGGLPAVSAVVHLAAQLAS